MANFFNIKSGFKIDFFDKDMEFISSYDSHNLVRPIHFSETINSGQGILEVELALGQFLVSKDVHFVKLYYLLGESYRWGEPAVHETLLYTGVFHSKNIEMRGRALITRFQFLGLNTLFANSYYRTKNKKSEYKGYIKDSVKNILLQTIASVGSYVLQVSSIAGIDEKKRYAFIKGSGNEREVLPIVNWWQKDGGNFVRISGNLGDLETGASLNIYEYNKDSNSYSISRGSTTLRKVTHGHIHSPKEIHNVENFSEALGEATIKIENSSCLDVLQRLQEFNSDNFFFIDQYGKLIFSESFKERGPKILTIDKEVLEFEYNDNPNEIINSVHIYRLKPKVKQSDTHPEEGITPGDSDEEADSSSSSGDNSNSEGDSGEIPPLYNVTIPEPDEIEEEFFIHDEDSIEQYGLREYVEEVDNMTLEQMKIYGKSKLKLSDKEIIFTCSMYEQVQNYNWARWSELNNTWDFYGSKTPLDLRSFINTDAVMNIKIGDVITVVGVPGDEKVLQELSNLQCVRKEFDGEILKITCGKYKSRLLP